MHKQVWQPYLNEKVMVLLLKKRSSWLAELCYMPLHTVYLVHSQLRQIEFLLSIRITYIYLPLLGRNLYKRDGF
jgi:hypothetical protein